MHLTPNVSAWAQGHPATIRWTLACLLALMALNAFAGGSYAMSGAQGVPVEWLEKTVFRDYFVPGMILFVVVGGSLAAAAYAVAQGHPRSKTAANLGGVLLLVWIGGQLVVIGYVSWMQRAVAAAALVIFALALMLPHEETAG